MPNALVITGFGINCNEETDRAFARAGATVRQVHLNDLIADPALLEAHHILAVPGGFSFGDDIASGRIFANRLRYRLGDAIERFVDSGKLVIGICNGFQVLVKMGLLPRTSGGLKQEVTVTHNDTNRYENRWVHLAVAPNTKCVWLKGIDQLEVPVRHGEGKFIPRDEAQLATFANEGLVALRYIKPDGAPANGEFPYNPNGATGDVAGICPKKAKASPSSATPSHTRQPTSNPFRTFR
jgi:phosphoribosylformylglycinamidine synthase